MKVAVLFAGPWIPGSVDMTEYLRQLRRLGHESLMICMDRSEGPPGYTVVVGDHNSLHDPQFYRRLQLDAAIVFAWFTYPGIISAMKKAGVRVLARGDSDGLLSIRQSPAHYIRAQMSAAKGAINSVIAARHLVQRYLFKYRREDRDRLASLAAADVSVLETADAARNASLFLEQRGRSDLIPRLQIVPHFVADDFLNCDVNPSRSESVVAIGRWEDSQKNAPLLAAAIERHLAHKPATRFHIIGGETGRSAFTSLTKKHPQVTYVGPQNPAGVRRYLSDARVLLSASRWEGSPVVANEALALGTTVVGTPITAFIDICSRGGFGTVAAGHSAKALAAALAGEWDQWDSGRRDPISISQYWRPLLSSEVVVSTLVRLLLGNPVKPRVDTRVAQTV